MKRKPRKPPRKLTPRQRKVRKIVGPGHFDYAVSSFGKGARDAAELYAQKIEEAQKKHKKIQRGRVLKLKKPGRGRERVPSVHFQKVGKHYVRIETTKEGREKITRTTLKAIHRAEGQLKYRARVNLRSEALGLSSKQSQKIETEVVRRAIARMEAFKKTKKFKSLSKAKQRRWTKKKTIKIARLGLDRLAGIY